MRALRRQDGILRSSGSGTAILYRSWLRASPSTDHRRFPCCRFVSIHILEYFSSLTCYSPVTDPTARIVRDDDFKGRVPQTPEEFASAFLASSAGLENRADMDSYRTEFVGKPERVIAYRQSASAEHATTSRKGSAYMISIPMQARAVMLRRLQILRGNMATQLIILM